MAVVATRPCLMACFVIKCVIHARSANREWVVVWVNDWPSQSEHLQGREGRMTIMLKWISKKHAVRVRSGENDLA